MITNLTGTVVAVEANFYRVRLDSELADECGHSELLCVRRARLKKIGQQVYVGDRITVDEPDWQGGRGAISQVEPRRSLLERPTIANIDRVLVVFALADPEPDPWQISRFLVKVASSDLPAIVCLNKRDLVADAQVTSWCDRLQTWGYDAIAISTYTGAGIDLLKAQIAKGVTIISGPSGVGKSSLINLLIPGSELRVGRVSQRLGHGRHTTRHVELFQLSDRGFLADSPGFTQPALTCAPIDLAYCFPEAQRLLAHNSCQFHNCWHRDEPGCAIRGDWERYGHYLVFLDEVEAYDAKTAASSTPDPSLKSKAIGGGKVRQEPKLLKKRHRRQSRRSQHQDLDLYSNEDL
ncbi:small ribosomal subunit biogenesis GTPase RsgA [Pseudanabaena sp. PCC 6802]|uniref:small ribosomal subunit biogenesis GTPase RsgA n=1 Tax=Pseudanabaena sp. PCC 6802 TaxID=118173 RepID=UPI0003479F06|nr:small ribosomal subunit biogenesis GTPase RsgA [Pseudanabaena sp. PCC 6802]